MSTVDAIVKEITDEIKGVSSSFSAKNVGNIVEIKDEIVFLSGFDDVQYGEILQFKNGATGLVVDLQEDLVGSIVFGDFLSLRQGDEAFGTKTIFSVPVGEAFLGRVVDGLANPIDGGGSISSKKNYPVERIAPGVVKRQPVNTSLQTGIKAIDAVIPIGRGQRELIIGDRGSGKTTIAIDTILNQKGQDVICIYTVIGQKRSNTAGIVDLLSKSGAMDYSIIVAATSSDPAAMQYVAPYVACALGEYFMDKGLDVLVIYDDLTKHAWAYRQVSLILRRPSGREAYPGDIFYLHSRLLERACRLEENQGGGSLTAIPIIETQEGDVSAYIPTNVISITDGQIILETDLFNSGVRPAVNVGSSVSRVGGAAQTKAIKQVAGKLKLDLAQYRELAAFAQFESELDADTKKTLDRGARMTELLKQKKNSPLRLSQQVSVLWAGVNGYFDEVPVKNMVVIEENFLEYVELKYKKLLNQIDSEKKIDEKTEKELKKIVEEFMKLHMKREV